ncbi:hypothetical protein LLH23_17125 [bacterium]|nr:hypothetical protein [bacterium]
MDPNRALKRIRLQPVDRIPHWEHFSNPDAFTLLSGIDAWQHPRLAAQKVAELYPLDMGVGIPATDDPIERLPEGESSFVNADGRKCVRWGGGMTSHWEWGKAFTSVEQAIAYQPLEHLDLREAQVVCNFDFRKSVEDWAQEIQGGELPRGEVPRGPACPHAGSGREDTPAHATPAGPAPAYAPPPRADHLKGAGFYNTIFMWPLLTFGWEVFLELAGGHKAELRRLMRDFSELSRKYFTAVTLTDVNYCVCHDDVCMARGPVCSPAWMHEFVYPYYEEFWSLMKASGIKVIFMTDGNPETIVDDIFACGADGLISEPFADYHDINRRHPDKILAGEGDNRILQTHDREAIRQMTQRMCQLGRECPGYFMCIGNHIPWNVPAESVKWYFEFSDEYGWL